MRRFPTLLAALPLVVAACGGSDTDGTSETGAAPTSSADTMETGETVTENPIFEEVAPGESLHVDALSLLGRVTWSNDPADLRDLIRSETVNDLDWFVAWSAEPADLMYSVTRFDRGDDDPCTDVALGDLPEFGFDAVWQLMPPAGFDPAGVAGIERAGPTGVRVLYNGDTSELQQAFEQIAELIARCVEGEMPFQEQGEPSPYGDEATIRIEPQDIGTVGDERVAVRVRVVQPHSHSPGWEENYAWVGFALEPGEGGHLAGAVLAEGWGHDGPGRPEPFTQQPMITGEVLASQLEAAFADCPWSR